MDSHTLSSASQYTSQQKLRVQQHSENGLLSVAYVRGRSTPVYIKILIAYDAYYCRSSDARDRPWRHYWYGNRWGTDALRLSNTAGHLSSRIIRFAQKRNFIDEESYIVLYVSLALFTVGATNSLGNDDLLAALAAGLPYRLRRHCVPAYPCV